MNLKTKYKYSSFKMNREVFTEYIVGENYFERYLNRYVIRSLKINYISLTNKGEIIK